MNISLGQIAFEAYSKAMQGKTYDGKPIPHWSELSEAVRDGWRAAAQSILQGTNRYILATDGDSHWYVIPADKVNEWNAWSDATEKYWDGCDYSNKPPDMPEWADEVNGSPQNVVFSEYEIE